MDYASIFWKIYALTESSNPVLVFIGLQETLFRQQDFVAIDGDEVADIGLTQVCHGVAAFPLVGDFPRQSPGAFQALACDLSCPWSKAPWCRLPWHGPYSWKGPPPGKYNR